jgi:hypothetical protein
MADMWNLIEKEVFIEGTELLELYQQQTNMPNPPSLTPPTAQCWQSTLIIPEEFQKVLFKAEPESIYNMETERPIIGKGSYMLWKPAKGQYSLALNNNMAETHSIHFVVR